MVKVTFMGTGAAFATSRRTNVAMLVQRGELNFLIECGPSVLYQLDQAGSAADQINYLFLSHRHGDHILGLPMFLLLRSMGGAPGPLTIVGNADVIRASQELLHLVYPELDRRLDSVTWIDVPVDEPASLAVETNLKLSTLPMPHSPDAPVSALRLDLPKSGHSIVYSGDTTYEERLAPFAADCDLLMHEANFCQVLHRGINAASYGHSTARQAGQTAARANCRILALVHLSPDYNGREDKVQEDAAQAFEGPIIVPNDGTTLYL